MLQSRTFLKFVRAGKIRFVFSQNIYKHNLHPYFMKIRRLNKRGQEAVSGFGVVGIVLVVFMVVVILGIWAVNKYWNLGIDHVPKNAEMIAKACSSFSKESYVNPYCLQIREADKNLYTTCDYAGNFNIVVLDSEGSNYTTVRMNKFCKDYSSALNGTIGDFCMKKEFSKRVRVNEMNCREWKEFLKLDDEGNPLPEESEEYVPGSQKPIGTK